MDSGDSRPGSSASNSSSNSSENSQRSLTSQGNDIKETQSFDEVNSHFPRRNSFSSNDGENGEGDFPRSPSTKSNTDSSSSGSSSDELDDAKPDEVSRNKNSSDRSSSCAEAPQQQTSPRLSSRHSSCSSNSQSHTGDNMNITHEDLSDVSDIENEKTQSSMNNSKNSIDDIETNGSALNSNINHTDEKDHDINNDVADLRHKLDERKNSKDIDIQTKIEVGPIDDLVKTNDEDALDFEAEEGECQDISKDDTVLTEEDKAEELRKTTTEDKEDGEELEDGEVSDEDEKRPEETEPKPVCRFYTRGQCTWGMSCRFLHPGVTDKGNYTMFDLVRPIPLTQSTSGLRTNNFGSHPVDYHDFRTERPAIARPSGLHAQNNYSTHSDHRVLDGPVVVESAWERGLRTAKEMMRKANKRKEQDMDFEDKKMNLTLSPDELEKDPYYQKDHASPPEVGTAYGRHAMYSESVIYGQDRYGRVAVAPFDEVPYGRTRYRELPPHRMPQYEDDRRVRPTREVIVQRVEPINRGDEWNDPWMRSKSPGDRNEKRRRDRRSYSSNSSYSSSSSSSQSDSSSDSSKSTKSNKKRRYNSTSNKSPRRHVGRSSRSSLHRRISPGRYSPVGSRRHLSPSVLEKKGKYSPPTKYKKHGITSIKKSRHDIQKVRKRHTSSSSASSDSSASDSDSESESSSSESSSRSGDQTPPKHSHHMEKSGVRKAVKRMEPPKKRSPISIEIKKTATVGVSALTSPTNSLLSEKDNKKSRREELLKQLRAVEDAIAKKRSKLV